MLDTTKPGGSIPVGTCFLQNENFRRFQIVFYLLIFLGLVPAEKNFLKVWLPHSISSPPFRCFCFGYFGLFCIFFWQTILGSFFLNFWVFFSFDFNHSHSFFLSQLVRRSESPLCSNDKFLFKWFWFLFYFSQLSHRSYLSRLFSAQRASIQLLSALFVMLCLCLCCIAGVLKLRFACMLKFLFM